MIKMITTGEVNDGTKVHSPGRCNLPLETAQRVAVRGLGWPCDGKNKPLGPVEACRVLSLTSDHIKAAPRGLKGELAGAIKKVAASDGVGVGVRETSRS